MVAPTGTEGSGASGAESGTTGAGQPMVAPTGNGSCFSYPFLFFGVFGCAEFRRFVVRRDTNTVGATNGRPRFAGGIFLFVALLLGEPGNRWSPLREQNIRGQSGGAGATGRATSGRPYGSRTSTGKRSVPRRRAVPGGNERKRKPPPPLAVGEVFGVKPGRAVPSGNGFRRRFTVYLLKRSLSFLRKPVRLVSFFSPPSSANFLSRSFCSCVSWRGTSTVTVKTRLPRLPL